MRSDDDTTVGEEDGELAQRLSRELTEFTNRATGVHDERGLSVRVLDEDGELAGGLTGGTWGACAGISLMWVRDDRRGTGLGSRLLTAAEAEAARRGCTQVLVSSFTFQAPGFVQRHGYAEFGRSEGIPTAGHADVHMVKPLR